MKKFNFLYRVSIVIAILQLVSPVVFSQSLPESIHGTIVIESSESIYRRSGNMTLAIPDSPSAPRYILESISLSGLLNVSDVSGVSAPIPIEVNQRGPNLKKSVKAILSGKGSEQGLHLIFHDIKLTQKDLGLNKGLEMTPSELIRSPHIGVSIKGAMLAQSGANEIIVINGNPQSLTLLSFDGPSISEINNKSAAQLKASLESQMTEAYNKKFFDRPYSAKFTIDYIFSPDSTVSFNDQYLRESGMFHMRYSIVFMPRKMT